MASENLRPRMQHRRRIRGHHKRGGARPRLTPRIHRCAPPTLIRAAAPSRREESQVSAMLVCGGENLMVSISECFSESYAEARPKFCGAAAAAGGALRSWLNPKARGPGGEARYLDTARFGPAGAANMLVLIAGTHGVAGPRGLGADIP